MKTPELVHAKDLFDILPKLAQTATRRIMLETMSLEGCGRMQPVFNEVLAASQRGVAVDIIYDRTYSFLDAARMRGLRGCADLRAAEVQAGKHGVRLHASGEVHPNPFAGRNHIKTFIFDDNVLTAGGTNLLDVTGDQRDFMLYYSGGVNGELADALAEALPRVAFTRKDRFMKLDERNEFIIDGGTRNNSPILERALGMVAGAASVVYVSKLLPDPRLARAIRGTEYQCYYNNSSESGLADRVCNAIDSKNGSRLENSYQGSRTIHAKYIVVIYPDGSMRAMTGSHNFNQRGIEWGTQELALDTTDQELCGKLLGFSTELNVDLDPTPSSSRVAGV